MEVIPAESQCTVRVIVAPNTASRVDVVFDPQLGKSQYENMVLIVILLRTINDLNTVLDRFCDQFSGVKFDHVKFNWTGTPERISNDVRVKQRILNTFTRIPHVNGNPSWRRIDVNELLGKSSSLFSNPPPGFPPHPQHDLKRLAILVKNNIELYGNAPNMQSNTSKDRRKTVNFIRSASGQRNLDEETAIQVAQIVLKN